MGQIWIGVDNREYLHAEAVAKNGGEKTLPKSLKGQFEESVWSHLAGTVREPCTLGDKKRSAMKVIDERGNELMMTRSEEDAV